MQVECALILDALIKTNLWHAMLFFGQFYPDKNHGLSGGGTSEHLYHLLTRFLAEKLSLSGDA